MSKRYGLVLLSLLVAASMQADDSILLDQIKFPDLVTLKSKFNNRGFEDFPQKDDVLTALAHQRMSVAAVVDKVHLAFFEATENLQTIEGKRAMISRRVDFVKILLSEHPSIFEVLKSRDMFE